MIPVGYFILTVVSMLGLFIVLFKIQSDDHKITVNALVARNAPEMKMLEATVPTTRLDRRFRRSLPENEGEFPEARPRPMGL